MIKQRIRSIIRDRLGIDISRAHKTVDKAPSSEPASHKYEKDLLYEADAFFNDTYSGGLERTGTPGSEKRRQRYYNLMQFLSQTISLEGSFAECGCWRGLSSFMICHYVKRQVPNFAGENYHIFDSFEGLSTPVEVDKITDKAVNTGQSFFGSSPGDFGGAPGDYSAQMDEVKNALNEFSNITYHKGWLPGSLEGIPEAKYKFVHIDVDLSEPTGGALEYFYPRLISGGIIVCDDYGSLYWPGAKKVVDDYCERHDAPLLTVSTGQAIIWKR